MRIYAFIFLLYAMPCLLCGDENSIDHRKAIEIVIDFLNINGNSYKTTRTETIMPFEVQAFQGSNGIIDYIDKTLKRVIVPDSNILISISDANYYFKRSSLKKVWRSPQKYVIVSFFSPRKGYAEPYLNMIFDLHKTTSGQLKIFLFGSMVNGKTMLDFFKIQRSVKDGAYFPITSIKE